MHGVGGTQALLRDTENRLTEVLSRIQDGVQLPRERQGHGPDHAERDQTLFVGQLYEVFVPVSATMPTITTTVHPTQTYTARLPVVTGSWHGVDGALGKVTKYNFADGSHLA